MLSYASRTLTAGEQNYTTMEKETLAVVFATQHFRAYLLGHKFQLITDNNAFKWLHSVEAKGRLARCVMDLQEFDFTIQHRPGYTNGNADALSRLNHTTSATQSHQASLNVKNSLALSCLVGQQSDPDISKVFEMKEGHFPKPPWFVWKDNKTLRSFLNCWDELYISNDLLVRIYTSKQGFTRPSAGHMSITQSLLQAKERFFWPRRMNASLILSIIASSAAKVKIAPHQPKPLSSPSRLVNHFSSGLWII